MKILAFIFAFCTLALSFTPCCDIDECSETCEQTSSKSDDDHQKTEENCSPFCQYNCCIGFVSLTFSKNICLSASLGIELFSLFTPEIPTSVVPKFWNPPKI